MMARLFTGRITNSAVDQLINLLPAVNRWLAEDPNAATRFLDGPVAALEAMQKSGALKDPIGDLLAVLRSAPRQHGGRRLQLVNLFRPTSVSFDTKAALPADSGANKPGNERRKRENG